MPCSLRQNLLPVNHVLAQISTSATLDALVRCRHTVLTRANELIDRSVTTSIDPAPDALPALTGLLMTSLEELKVAEEELREQNSQLAERRADEERQLYHYRQLFLQLPMPAMITDLYATIQQINDAAGQLFRREARHLERKPFAALLATSQRDHFRRQIARIGPDTPLTDWRLQLNRVGDLPLESHATVKLIPNLGATGSGVLYWVFRPTSNS
jgi:PAS domain-containing protein